MSLFESSLSTGRGKIKNKLKRIEISPMKKILLLFVIFMMFSGSVPAQELDWTTWRKLPVFSHGRVVPLETYARRLVSQICRTDAPVLQLDEHVLEEAMRAGHLTVDQVRNIRQKFPDAGKGKRKFPSYVLLFEWLADPELWDYIPFLYVETSDARKNYLGVDSGTGSPYVTPYSVSEHAEVIEQLLTNYDAAKQNLDEASGTVRRYGKTLENLKTAYLQFRSFTADPNVATPQMTVSMLEQAVVSLMEALRTYEMLQQSGVSELELPFTQNAEMKALTQKIQTVYLLYRRSLEETGEPVDSRKAEMLFEVTLRSLEEMLPAAERYRRQIFTSDGTDDLSLQRPRMLAETFFFQLQQIRMFCEAGYIALYDSEDMLHVCPLLSAEVLKADRSQKISGQPWLSLQTFLRGSDAMVRRFADPNLPQVEDELAEDNTHRKIKIAFHEMVAAYQSVDFNRVKLFADASRNLAERLRRIAETSEPVRRNLLPADSQSGEIFAKTAMPEPLVITAEFYYEILAPFRNMWRGSLTAFCLLLISALLSCLPKSLKRFELFFFWTGSVFLILTELVTLTGIVFRTYFTGWLPISSKYETVVFLAFSLVGLGFWATFYPLFRDRLKKAWIRTSLADSRSRQVTKNTTQWKRILLLPRAILTVLTLYLLLWASYGELSGGVLRWNTVKEAFLMNDPLDWIAVILCMGLIVWAVPRAVLTLLLIPFVGPPIPGEKDSRGSQNKPVSTKTVWNQILERKIFLLAAAFLAVGAGKYASAQVMNFSPLQAVLRSNFWLAVHIVAIMISYASGAIAWLLALIATVACLFGKWKQESSKTGPSAIELPWLSRLLIPYLQNLIGVTVLCLAIGTILGGRWADYSWGRFWGWDPKEVWALVTLLFYVIVLHGRVAKLYGNFGLILGGLFGLFAIVMTWYGVNEVLKGSRHAYAASDTGSWVTTLLLCFVAANIFLGMLALFRYLIKKTILEAEIYNDQYKS
jgi:ABC-type transport system involved in cytochrome c biogenesis permease subunit